LQWTSHRRARSAASLRTCGTPLARRSGRGDRLHAQREPRRPPPASRRGSGETDGPRVARARSWADLNARLFQGTWSRELGRHRGTLAYRGTTTVDGALDTALERLGIAGREPHLLRNFRKFAGPVAISRDSEWDWLALAQHHGLPTRLLVWSFSPYVALHFATRDLARVDPGRPVEDGIVWCVDYVAAHRRLPPMLRSALRRESAEVFTTEMLASVAAGPGDLDALAREPFLLFLDPPSLDARLVNQFALFSLLTGPGRRLRDYLERHPRIGRAVIIPASLKWEVRDRLDQINVTERVLFPGLDGLSRWLTRYYAPRVSRPTPGPRRPSRAPRRRAPSRVRAR
jgi:hypothetical protein